MNSTLSQIRPLLNADQQSKLDYDKREQFRAQDSALGPSHNGNKAAVTCVRCKEPAGSYKPERGSNCYARDKDRALCPVDLSVRVFSDGILVIRCVPP